MNSLEYKAILSKNKVKNIKENKNYPAKTLLEKLLLNLNKAYIFILLTLIILLAFHDYLGELVFWITILTIIVSPIIIYLVNVYIIPKILIKNYDKEYELYRELKSISSTAPFIKCDLKTFRFRLQKNIRRNNYKIRNMYKDNLIATKKVVPKDIRLGWTYSFYRKLKFNIIYIIGDLNIKLDESYLVDGVENFIIHINIVKSISDKKKNEYELSSEIDEIYENKYHIKKIYMGYNIDDGLLYYRNPYIRISFDSKLLKRGITNKEIERVKIKGIYDELSTNILTKEIVGILLEK